MAKNLNPNDWVITGTSKSKVGDEYCRILGDNKFEIKTVLQNSTHLVISIPPNDGGDVVFHFGTGYFGVRDENGNFSMDKLVKLVEDNPLQGISNNIFSTFINFLENK